MRSKNSGTPSTIRIVVFIILLSAGSVFAQTGEAEQLREKVTVMMEELKYSQALPSLKRLAELTPNDAQVFYYLGFANLGESKNTEDPARRKSLRAAARAAFVKARELGDDSLLVLSMVETIPLDGSGEPSYAEDREANAIMEKAEAAFSSGRIDEAYKLYQAALKLDPKLYFAALFSGDVHLKKGEFDAAEVWYQRAIKIDPNIETAYRYSATPLMRQRKYSQARDRYIEAFITEPYNRLAASGLIQWGEATRTPLGHPRMDTPEFSIGEDGKAKSTISISTLSEDGSMAWIGYTATRSAWYEGKFKKTFPRETEYRHSLQEEAEAFRSVLTLVNDLKDKSSKLNPQLAVLQQIEKDGLLEAFILLARGTPGISKDHPDYVKTNRDKLRQYVIKYVIGAGQ